MRHTNLRRGFSLSEMLIVIGIIVIIAVVSFINLIGWREQKQLSNASKQIATLLRQAQSRSVAQEGAGKWGVLFVAPSGGEDAYFALYAGTSDDIVERYALPENATFNTNGWVGGELPLAFQEVTGVPDITNATSGISLYFPNGENSVSVVVASSGSITYETISCFLASCTVQETTIVGGK